MDGFTLSFSYLGAEQVEHRLRVVCDTLLCDDDGSSQYHVAQASVIETLLDQAQQNLRLIAAHAKQIAVPREDESLIDTGVTLTPSAPRALP